MDVKWANAERRSKREERGSVLVEFAFVFALFVLVIFALVVFGIMLAAKNSITHAAAEGARSAVGVVDDPATPVDEREERARQKVGESLDWFGSKYQPGDTTVSVAPCGSAECITVTIKYPYESRPLIPAPPLLDMVTPKQLTSTAVVELT